VGICAGAAPPGSELRGGGCTWPALAPLVGRGICCFRVSQRQESCGLRVHWGFWIEAVGPASVDYQKRGEFARAGQAPKTPLCPLRRKGARSCDATGRRIFAPSCAILRHRRCGQTFSRAQAPFTTRDHWGSAAGGPISAATGPRSHFSRTSSLTDHRNILKGCHRPAIGVAPSRRHTHALAHTPALLSAPARFEPESFAGRRLRANAGLARAARRSAARSLPRRAQAR
jgi:hypothetical protein